MFQKHDDVKEFDDHVMKIRRLVDTATPAKIAVDITALMRALTWHNWTPKEDYPPWMVENLLQKDGNLVTQFVDACLIFLETSFVPDLRLSADTYLQKRGLKAATPKALSPQCTIPQWLKAFRDAKAYFGEQRKFESELKKLGEQGIAHKPENHPRASWAIELWYLDENGIKVPSIN